MTHQKFHLQGEYLGNWALQKAQPRYFGFSTASFGILPWDKRSGESSKGKLRCPEVFSSQEKSKAVEGQDLCAMDLVPLGFSSLQVEQKAELLLFLIFHRKLPEPEDSFQSCFLGTNSALLFPSPHLFPLFPSFFFSLFFLFNSLWKSFACPHLSFSALELHLGKTGSRRTSQAKKIYSFWRFLVLPFPCPAAAPNILLSRTFVSNRWIFLHSKPKNLLPITRNGRLTENQRKIPSCPLPNGHKRDQDAVDEPGEQILSFPRLEKNAF